jgi:hypothetical protein
MNIAIPPDGSKPETTGREQMADEGKMNARVHLGLHFRRKSLEIASYLRLTMT